MVAGMVRAGGRHQDDHLRGHGGLRQAIGRIQQGAGPWVVADVSFPRPGSADTGASGPRLRTAGR